MVWWQKGAYAQEDEALEETVAAFEQGSGKQVEITFVEKNELPVLRECRYAGSCTAPWR